MRLGGKVKREIFDKYSMWRHLGEICCVSDFWDVREDLLLCPFRSHLVNTQILCEVLRGSRT